MENLNKKLAQDQFITVSKLPFGAGHPISLSKDSSWMKIILENQCISDALPEQSLLDESCYILFDATVTKTSKPYLKEMIVLEGELKCKYQTLCVNSLEKMHEEIMIDLKACFISSSYKNSPEYESEIDISHKEDLYDLYFHEKNIIDLKEVLSSYLILNMNPYPKLKDFHEAHIQ
jgi:hypothetical protein